MYEFDKIRHNNACVPLQWILYDFLHFGLRSYKFRISICFLNNKALSHLKMLECCFLSLEERKSMGYICEVMQIRWFKIILKLIERSKINESIQ